jgi:hypothetical protein
MSFEIIPRRQGKLLTVPAIIADAGDNAARRFLEFFTANIANLNTRAAYARAVAQFLRWCEHRRLTLRTIEPIAIAAYFQAHTGSDPTKKQHLAVVRMPFDWLVTGQVVPSNPASSVRGPKHVVKRGKTPKLGVSGDRHHRFSGTQKLAGMRSVRLRSYHPHTHLSQVPEPWLTAGQ